MKKVLLVISAVMLVSTSYSTLAAPKPKLAQKARQIPGPQGPAGPAGQNGKDGVTTVIHAGSAGPSQCIQNDLAGRWVLDINENENKIEILVDANGNVTLKGMKTADFNAQGQPAEIETTDFFGTKFVDSYSYKDYVGVVTIDPNSYNQCEFSGYIDGDTGKSSDTDFTMSYTKGTSKAKVKGVISPDKMTIRFDKVGDQYQDPLCGQYIELDSSWSGQSFPNGWDPITNTAITTVDDCTNKADREYVNYEKTDGNGGTKNAYAMCKAGKPYIGIYCSTGISFGGTAIKAQ
jgi:hypothetical protein